MAYPHFGESRPVDATEDHVYPRAKGGKVESHGGNILLACYRCNNRKGHRAPRVCELLIANWAREAYERDMAMRQERENRRAA